jgi:hypothetical protein
MNAEIDMARLKTALALKITEKQKAALVRTLRLLEAGKLKHVDPQDIADGPTPKRKVFSGLFNMRTWQHPTPCGTVACIGGTAEMIGKVRFGDSYEKNPDLHDLLYPAQTTMPDRFITTKHAAKALRNYLTTGKPAWSKVTLATAKRMNLAVNHL